MKPRPSIKKLNRRVGKYQAEIKERLSKNVLRLLRWLGVPPKLSGYDCSLLEQGKSTYVIINLRYLKRAATFYRIVVPLRLLETEDYDKADKSYTTKLALMRQRLFEDLERVSIANEELLQRWKEEHKGYQTILTAVRKRVAPKGKTKAVKVSTQKAQKARSKRVRSANEVKSPPPRKDQ